MDAAEQQRLVNDWIAFHHAEEDTSECDELRWAEQKLSSLSFEDPMLCLDLVLEIIKLDTSDKVIAGLAAGPVEDMLVEKGDLVISRFEKLASANTLFKKILGGVWLGDEVSESIVNRFEAIRGDRW